MTKQQRRVLFVDDDSHILRGYVRRLSDMFDLETAFDGADGLGKLKTDGPFAVVVSDLKMPGMSGIEFLQCVKDDYPDTIRIMLTGYADLETTIDAVNEGNIFRFLTKPCPADMLAKAVNAGIEQYNLVMSERVLLNKTLKGSLDVLSDILSLVNPTAFNQSTRVRRLAHQIAEVLGLPYIWHLDMAATLSQIGCVAIPPSILTRVYAQEDIAPNEMRMYRSHPQAAYELLAKIPRMSLVAKIIQSQYDDPYPLTGNLAALSAEDDIVAVSSQILMVASEFDKLLQNGLSYLDAILDFRRREWHITPQILDALTTLPGAEGTAKIREVSLSELRVGMIVEGTILSKQDLVLVAKGQEITLPLLLRLKQFAKSVGIQEPLLIKLDH